MPLNADLNTIKDELRSLDLFKIGSSPSVLSEKDAVLYGFLALAVKSLETLSSTGINTNLEFDYDAMAEAFAVRDEPQAILTTDNFTTGVYTNYFVVTPSNGVLKAISYQVIPNLTTTADYWILAYNQSSGIPSGIPHRIGFIRNGVMESEGYDWSEFYKQGVKFVNGITIAISTNSNSYVPPTTPELFIKVGYTNISTPQPTT